MTETEFKVLRHIAWDRGFLDGPDEQCFCICTTPEQHLRYEMDQAGDKAKAILGRDGNVAP